MKRRLIYKIISLITLISLLVTFVPPHTTLARRQAQLDLCSELFASYSARGTEVIEIKCTNETVDPSGNISVDMAIEAKTSLTYGFLLSVENGAVSGQAIEIFLRATNRAIPLVGKRTLNLGRVTFSPDAHLKIIFNKFELVSGDAPMLLGLDLVTAFLLFTGIGNIPTKPAELLPGIAQAFVQLLNNIGFDGALFATQLQLGDYLGALQTLASMFVKAPELFADFLLREYNISVAPETIKNFGIQAGHVLPIIGVFPVIRDLILRPRSAQVDINTLNPVGAPVDVYMLVDLSSSFADDLPVFEAQAPEIISALKASNPNIRFGLGRFEDYPIPPFGSESYGDQAYQRVVDLTSDTNLVLNAISGLSVRWGDDTPESQLAALFQAVTGAGQNLSETGYPGASIPAGQQANFGGGATKLIILWTDAPFHRPGDPGNIPYPGPSFDETKSAIRNIGGKVIGIYSSGLAAVSTANQGIPEQPPRTDIISVASDGLSDLNEIATGTGALAPADGVDCNSDGIIDVAAGNPLVCSIASTGEGISEAVIALVEAAAEPRMAKVALTMTDNPDPVNTGQNIIYNLTVANNGPDTGIGMTLTDILPPEVTFVSATPSQGDCTQASGHVICNLNDLANGGTARVTIIAASTGKGAITNIAIVAANESDPNDDDNIATENTTILQGIYLPIIQKNSSGSSPPTPTGPAPGFWESTTGDEFYVTTDRAYVDNFAIYFSVSGCGNYKITHIPLERITNNHFSFSGSFYASGTFNSATTASGTDGLNNFNISGCGIVSGGPWSWNATWQNNAQPALMPATVVGPEVVEPVTAPAKFYIVTPAK